MTREATHPHGDGNPTPRVVAWETTRRCPYDCRHCRGEARDRDYQGEMTREEGMRLVDRLSEAGSPILIFTGGEPMARPDIYDLVARAVQNGLRAVMAPCGHLLTVQAAHRLVECGLSRISISLDGPDAATHDAFRGVPGAFEAALRGLRNAREAGLEFQINTTVTRDNVGRLPGMLDLAVDLGAVGLDAFFLVPTGRGAGIADLQVPADESEHALEWLLRQAQEAPIQVKPTCAPQYARLAHQRDVAESIPRRGLGGCMAGRGFVFVSHRGVVQPCGFLDIACGDLRETGFDLCRVYRESPVLRELRQPGEYRGKCGVCEYATVCGGCRARAYASTGDYLAPDPTCAYVPQTKEQTA